MKISPETRLKAEILTRGIRFSPAALAQAAAEKAKGQNWVYNAPISADVKRPQELFLTAEDGYTTVVSCVAPSNQTRAVLLESHLNGELLALVDGQPVASVVISYVPEPSYYQQRLANGQLARQYVTACGYDELNIIPWRGCVISKTCKFCGVNTIGRQSDDCLNAAKLSRYPMLWQEMKGEYLASLKEAITQALPDPCYNEHLHVILISGNLSDSQLDQQAEIYAEITSHIKPLVSNKASEGIIAVITPPQSLRHIDHLKQSGIDIVVFNLEVSNEPWFSKYCPGKSHLGVNFFTERLFYARDIFGHGKVWTNFVLGLEPIDSLLVFCDQLAAKGIVSGANVLHLDEGNHLDCSAPSLETVVEFFCRLADIYRAHNLEPFYCAKALRTSLSNEAFVGRIHR